MALVLLVGCGGFLGTVFRFLVGLLLNKLYTGTIPYSTILINLLGSFFVGFALSAFESKSPSATFYFLVPGFLGGFTTYSAFSAETVSLISRQLFVPALGYVLITLCGGLIFCALGMFISKLMFGWN